jgi:hypothetical protein
MPIPPEADASLSGARASGRSGLANSFRALSSLSLEIMEGVMRHIYQRAWIEQRMGPQADWSVVDALMLKTLAAAEKVTRYKHAQLSAVRVAGDISGKMDDVTLDELLVTVKQEWAKLSPLIDLDTVEEPEPQAITSRRTPPPKWPSTFSSDNVPPEHRKMRGRVRRSARDCGVAR